MRTNEGVEVKKNDVKGKENQGKGKKIMVQNKEMEDQEKKKEKMRKINSREKRCTLCGGAVSLLVCGMTSRILFFL